MEDGVILLLDSIDISSSPDSGGHSTHLSARHLARKSDTYLHINVDFRPGSLSPVAQTIHKTKQTKKREKEDGRRRLTKKLANPAEIHVLKPKPMNRVLARGDSHGSRQRHWLRIESRWKLCLMKLLHAFVGISSRRERQSNRFEFLLDFPNGLVDVSTAGSIRRQIFPFPLFLLLLLPFLFKHFHQDK